jgi:four helix bundle protein
MKDFKKLIVWQKSILLVKYIYSETKNFPKEELFGITNQIKRAAVSIPSNIAEGAGRGTKEFNHFLNIAKGSAFELETQIIIAKELDFIQSITFETLNSQIIEIQKMLSGLQKSLKIT